MSSRNYTPKNINFLVQVVQESKNLRVQNQAIRTLGSSGVAHELVFKKLLALLEKEENKLLQGHILRSLTENLPKEKS